MTAKESAAIATLRVPGDHREFRNALGNFATGITIITARGPAGELVGLTASSFNSVSMDPPLVLFSLARGAYSLGSFLRSDHFCVNVLAEEQEALAHRFARPLADKWSGVEYELTGSGCPVLPGCLATFECRIHHTYDGGDHVILVGNVLSMRSRVEGRPLLYFRGRYRGLRDVE